MDGVVSVGCDLRWMRRALSYTSIFSFKELGMVREV